MNLREQMRLDVQNAFFRTNEFSEKHKLNGTNVEMIVEYFTISGKPLANIEGVLYYNATIHLPSKFIPVLPSRGEDMHLDDVLMTVDGSANNMGVTTIILKGDGSM